MTIGLCFCAQRRTHEYILDVAEFEVVVASAGKIGTKIQNFFHYTHEK